MTNQTNPNTCPKCGATIPTDAPQGLCPKCVLLGAATTDDDISPTATTEIPSLERVAAAFPQLEIVELLGRGGMGFVFKARQPHLDRFVALKLLPDKLARDPHFAERFSREGRVLAKLNHPGIVSIYDFGQTGGFYFLLMEYVDGVNLRQAMQAGKFSPSAALGIVPKICEALQFAHEQGVLHRDIKPANILLDTKGRVKIADFGIAKLIGDEKPDLNLTATGAAIGTPQYMSPEQLEKPGTVDHRADIYSLGVVFYEMLTGELPIGRFSPPSQRTPVDPRVDEVVMRTLEKEREKRYQSADEVKTKVEHLTEVGAGDFEGAPAQAAAGSKQGPHGTMAVRPSMLRSKLVFGNRRGYLKWAFLALMACALGYWALSNRARNQANNGKPDDAASAKLQGAPVDATNKSPWIRFTFTAVEVREVAGKRWLAIDYLDNVHGECQKAFPWETKIPGFQVEVRTSEFLKENTDSPAVRHQRAEYLMPDSVPRAQLDQLRGEVEKALKQKTIRLELGEQQLLFEFGSSSETSLKAWIKVVSPPKIRA